MKKKVLRYCPRSKARKVIYSPIEIKPVQNSDHLFYFIKPGDSSINAALVWKKDGVYVQHYATCCQDLTDPNTLKYIELFESWFDGLEKSTSPTALEIRLYKELGHNYELLEARAKKKEEEYRDEMEFLMEFLRGGGDINGSEFIRLCHFKEFKIPPGIFGTVAWSTKVINIQKVWILSSVDSWLAKEVQKFVRKFIRKFITIPRQKLQEQMEIEQEERDYKYSREGFLARYGDMLKEK